MQVSGYWTTTSAADQAEILKTVKQADLEQYAADNFLILYKGKLYDDPAKVPCMCDMEAPDHCFTDTIWPRGHKWTAEEKKDKCCYCPCHTYYEPF